MKTTIELPDPLLRDARAIAAREKTTLKALMEEGLRTVVEKRRKRKKPFKLRMVGFRGQGLHPDIGEWSWEKIRDIIYEGRGT